VLRIRGLGAEPESIPFFTPEGKFHFSGSRATFRGNFSTHYKKGAKGGKIIFICGHLYKKGEKPQKELTFDALPEKTSSQNARYGLFNARAI